MDIELSFPWVVDRDYVKTATGVIIYCDREYYPWSDLTRDEWIELCEFLNRHHWKEYKNV